MSAGYIESHEVKGDDKVGFHTRRQIIAAATITDAQILILSGVSGDYDTAVLADATAGLTTYGVLGIADTGGVTIPSGYVLGMVTFRRIDTSVTATVNTAAATAGDPVYLSDTPGAWSLTPGTIELVIGEVLYSHATAGVIRLDLQANYHGGTVLSGTNALSFSVNQDAAATFDEDPKLYLVGGDAVPAPNNDIVRSGFIQDSTAELTYFELQRARNGGAYAQIPPALHLGVPSAVADLDPSLVFNAGTGAAALAASISYDGGSNLLVFDVASATGQGVLRTGTDTAATSWQVRNNSDAPLYTFLGSGVMQMNENQSFVNDTDTQGSVGTSALRWGLVSSVLHDVFAASADANPTARLSTGALSFGGGAGNPVDWVLSRQNINVATLADGDSMYAVNTGLIGVRALVADANPTTVLGNGTLSFGGGGAGAVDWVLSRQAAAVMEIGQNQSLFALGNGTIGIRSVTGAANVSASLSSDGIRLGPGGAGVVDVILTRSAVDTLQLVSGFFDFANGGTTVFRNAAAELAIWHDDVFVIADSADSTKRLIFDAAPITAGQTRTITAADRSQSATQFDVVALADPGGAGQAIPVTDSASIALVVAAGAETNTLGLPTFVGQRMLLNLESTGGGTRAVTAASAINQAGNTIMTFGLAQDFIELVGTRVAAVGTLAWRVSANDGVLLS